MYLFYKVPGTYGNGRRPNPCKVFVAYDEFNQCSWYVVSGSVTVNCSPIKVEAGTHVEDLSDIDVFTWNKPIKTMREFKKAMQ